MPRAAITRSILAAVALTLLLSGSAAAATGAHRGLAAASAPAAEQGIAAHLSAAWRWWAELWSPGLTSARGHEGSGVDPNGITGKPAVLGALPGYATVSGDQGPGIDPNGSH